MKSKILLVYLPGYEIGYGPIFPLGIGYLFSAIEQDRPVKAVHYQLMEHAEQQMPEIIASFKPDIIGLTCSTFNRGNVRKMCFWIKNHHPNIKIILGGVHVTYLVEQALRTYGADYVVLREGENTIKELCNAIDSNSVTEDIKGIAFLQGSHVVTTELREVVQKLDDIETPNFSYAGDIMRSSGLGFVFTSRGCPAHCTFCSTSSYWGKVRVHSVKRIVDEMEIMLKEYGVKKLLFHDDTFNLSTKRVDDICNEILVRNLDVTWAASCRVNPVSQEMVDKMVEAGCRHICWGVESGSAEILEQINKKITQEQITQAFECCRKHIGTISVGVFSMVGNSGESERTIKESVAFLNTLPMTDSPSPAVLYVLPGTTIYEDIKRKNPKVDDFWISCDGIMRPKEYNSVQLQQWAVRVGQSGNRIPFDRNNHFFNNILFGNIPTPVLGNT